MSSTGDNADRSKLSATWQRRFMVFDEAGGAFNVNESPTYKSMDFIESTFVTFNPWAFLFGFIYYFIIGIPKRAAGITIITILIFIALYSSDVSPDWLRILGIANQVSYAVFANYFYYIKFTQGRDEWDPLKDIRQT